MHPHFPRPNVVKLGERLIGTGYPAYFIAEIGSNHDGSLERAKELIGLAARNGADAVKFQSFTAAGLIAARRRDEHGRVTEHPAWPTLERLTVPGEWHEPLSRHARSQGVQFISTPFEEGRVDLLESLGVPAYKVASGDLTHYPLLRHIARLGKPVILSTGIADLAEVGAALDVLDRAGCREVVLLHCVSTYPTRFQHSNVRAMKTMADAYGRLVGLSDHTPGAVVPLAAVTLGACVVEKHVTTDRKLPGPDHPYAMRMEEFGQMVADVRNLELALGDGIKRPAEPELPEIIGARRSLHARRPIARGCPVTGDALKIVRHGDGIPPAMLEVVVGRLARADIDQDQPITWDLV